MPDSNAPSPLALSAPWTRRKSIARGRTRDTCCMTIASPLVLTAVTRLTITNTGSSVQNAAPGLRSSPGHAATSGRSNQGGSRPRPASYTPRTAATAQPEAIPMSGAQNRKIPVARNASTVATPNVTAPENRPAPGDAPAGTTFSLPTATAMTVTAMRMSAVPDTTGVMMRRSSGSHAAMANCTSDDTTMRLASVDSPPFSCARTEIAMKCGPAPVMST